MTLTEPHKPNGAAHGADTNTLKPINAADLEGKRVPKRAWDVDQYIPRWKPVLIYGDGAAGKSTITKQLCVCKSARMDWLGLKAEPGRTLFLSAEDDDDELHIRFDCIRTEMGLRWADLADVNFQSLLDKDPTLGEFSKQQGKVIGTPLLAELEEQVRDTMIDTVILDTLSDVFAGDENDRQQARSFVRLLARLGLRTQSTVLALAHPSLSGMASGTGTSGSTGWSNAVRARLYLHGDKDGGDGGRILQVMKANYGPPNLRIKLRWQRGLYVPISTATDEAQAKSSAEAAEECFMRLLDAYAAEKRNVSTNPSATYAPSVFEKDKRSGNVDKLALVAAMNALFANGMIVNEEFGSKSHLRSRIIRRKAT